MRPTWNLLLRSIRHFVTGRIRLDERLSNEVRKVGAHKTLVYVLPSASVLEHLLMNALALQQDLPLARYANDVPTLLFQPFGIAWRAALERLRAWAHSPAWRIRQECRIAAAHVKRREPLLLFLKKPGLFSGSIRWRVPLWEEIVRLQREGEANIVLVPVAFLWGRQPERIRPTLTDILLGETSAPGYVRKGLLFLRHFRSVGVRLGEPTDVGAFLTRTGPARDEIHAKKLRRLVSNYLFRERRLLAGPPLRSHKRVIRVLLKDPELKRLVPGIARREKMSEARVWKRARKILNEMIADYSPRHIAFSYRAFRWLWDRLYDRLEVDQAGLDRLKAVARDFPVILTPSHKSHVDYLILSGLFYENDIMIPHICAGINLSFWPMGAIFRRNGAFFIRRKITGDLLYARLLALYVRWLIRCGYTQEFFIEGGRTRTGKIVFPKHGLLSLQVEAFLTGTVRDLYVVPAAITYERVPEDEAYVRELTGTPKAKENFWTLWKARHILKRSHGSAYVRFAKPISLKDYFHVEPGVPVPLKEQRAGTLDLAIDIVRGITAETTVTLSSLATAALLTQREPAILLSTLKERMHLFSHYLKRLDAPQTSQAQELDFHIEWLLDFFSEHDWLESIEGEGEARLIRFRDDRRLMLDFYKNTILHQFLPAALTGVAVEHGEKGGPLEGDIGFLLDLFAHEFFLKPDDTARNLLERGTPWAGPDADRTQRNLFAGLVTNYLESYDLAAQTVLKEGDARFPAGKAFVFRGLQLGEQLFATGEITRREALSSANLQSAVGYFHMRNLLKDPEALKSWHDHLRKLLGK